MLKVNLKIFFKNGKIAKNCGRTNHVKRRCGQQIDKENYESGPDPFYGTFFIHYLDTLASQLQSRFNWLNTSAIWSLHLLPKNLRFLVSAIKSNTINYCRADLPNTNAFTQDICLWKNWWRYLPSSD